MTKLLNKEIIEHELKDAIYEVLHNSEKPLKAISQETGIKYSTIERTGLKTKSKSNFQLWWIPLVTLSSNNYNVLDKLEQLVGRVGVPLPPPLCGASTADICRSTMAAMKEFGELIAEIERATADNQIKQSERERIQREGYQALQALLVLLLACKIPGKKIFEV